MYVWNFKNMYIIGSVDSLMDLRNNGTRKGKDMDGYTSHNVQQYLRGFGRFTFKNDKAIKNY